MYKLCIFLESSLYAYTSYHLIDQSSGLQLFVIITLIVFACVYFLNMR